MPAEQSATVRFVIVRRAMTVAVVLLFQSVNRCAPAAAD
jgi:hypothetical protein